MGRKIKDVHVQMTLNYDDAVDACPGLGSMSERNPRYVYIIKGFTKYRVVVTRWQKSRSDDIFIKIPLLGNCLLSGSRVTCAIFKSMITIPFCRSEKVKPPYTIEQYDSVLIDLSKRKEAALLKILSQPKSENSLKEALATSRKYSRLIDTFRKDRYNYHFKK